MDGNTPVGVTVPAMHITPVRLTPTAACRRRLTLILAGALAVACSAFGLGVSPTPAHADGHAWDYLMPPIGACGPAENNANAVNYDQAKAGLCVANAVRQNYGRTRLGPEPGGLGRLFYASYFKARDVERCPDDNVHTACKRPMDYWINNYHYRVNCTGGYWAENIYTGWGYPANTAREAVRWWLNSDAGHRDALLNPIYTKHGMGVRRVVGTYKGHADTQIWVHYLCN
jgi:hypothetical protein